MRVFPSVFRIQIAGALVASLALPCAALAELKFKEVGGEAQVAYSFDYATVPDNSFENMAGGVAAGDYDNDGDIDLYLLTGDLTPNRLLNNQGDGTFKDVNDLAGTNIGLPGHLTSSPVFADIDGDGWLDLYVGGIRGWGHYVFRNQGDGTFSDFTEQSGLYWEEDEQNEYSAAFGDPDRDGDLDMFVSHWGARGEINHFWWNDGSGRFSPADKHTGYVVRNERDYTFTPTFADINADGWQDMLLVADFLRTQVLINDQGRRWIDTTTEVFTDESGMGSAVADFDNDGDLDWFVTAIYHEDTNKESVGSTGNRMYVNDGHGTFSDGTEAAGVRKGAWGWAACAADFNNDGWLDIYHVNGMPMRLDFTDFQIDRSVLFINQQDGTFVEQALESNINEPDQGRGIVCFDYDGDGDIDILTQNWKSNTNLYRNDQDEGNNWLQVRLKGEQINPFGIGAVITLEAGGIQQMREVTVGSNFASQNPLLQHFGLGQHDTVERIRVQWPHGGVTELTNVSANQVLEISAQQSEPEPFAFEPGLSAAWYDPSHNGEGFLLEFLEGGVTVLYWFTYDAEGEQDWYVAVGQAEGRSVLFPELIRVSGGEFGDGFDPTKITRTPVGSAKFSWNDCSSGTMDWFIGEDHDRQDVQRLSTLMGMECGVPRTTPERPEGQYSGSWFDPTHDGEGFVVEVLSNSQVLIYWFGYSPEGKRRWFFGLGEIEEGKLVVQDFYTTAGGIFGQDFDPTTVDVIPWGNLTLDITCNGGTATWESTEPGFDPGQLNLTRLTTLAGLSCE